MALTRSASGPGGLSISTGAANSLFGSGTSQAPASGGAFGSASKPASGGMFGNSTATTSAPATGGLFGNPGGLFGSNTAATSAPAGSGGLFGGATAASQPAQSGGLFGNSTATSQPAQSGGLFGATTTSQPQQAGGLFGGSTQQSGGLFGSNQQNQMQGTSTGGLFSGLNNQNQPANTLFGASQAQQSQQQQQQQNNTGFGSTLTGGLTLGQNNSSAPSQLGVKINVDNLRSTTRFNDLHEDLQRVIEDLDKGIQHAQSQCNDIVAIIPSHHEQLSLIPDSVDFAQRKHLGVDSALESDAESLHFLQKLTDRDIEHAKHAFDAVNVLMLPQQYQQTTRHFQNFSPNAGGSGSHDLVSFFSETADEMTGQLDTYKRRLGEIESHLRSVEAATIHQAQMLGRGNGNDDRGDEMREVALVLREFESGILNVAGKVGATREGLQKLQLGGFEDLGRDRAGRMNGHGKRNGIY